MISVGILGCGYWGPNHIRVFSQSKDSQVSICVDLDNERLSFVQQLYPSVKTSKNAEDILTNSAIDAVVISLPTKMHYEFTKKALINGKHVLCEKPLALTKDECDELQHLADKNNVVLLVGHVFLFNSGIQTIKQYIDSGELGNIYYAKSERTNLGPFRYDVNALWDLAPHDISIFNYLFESAPLNVSARGQKCLGNSLEDLAFANMEYANNIMANVHVSWLDPRKVRQITIVGDKKMLVWDDLDNLGPIRVYDKHVEKTETYYQTYGEFQLLSKEGSITIPKIKMQEPLKAQGQFFLDCINKQANPKLSDGSFASGVVQALCAIQTSCEQKGHSITL